MKSITISFILILYTSLSFAQENSGLPLIDMHVHWGPGLEKYDERRIQTLDRLAENNVVMAVYFSKIPEALSREIQNAQTEMLPYLGMICSESHSLYPCYPGSRGAFPDLDWLRNEVQAGRIVGLGEVNAQYYSIKPTDPRMEPFFALAEELDIPVGYHMGLGPPGSAYRRPYRLSYGNPLLLEEILVRYPKLRLYVQHAALPYLQEMMGIMIMYPQVYVDLSAISSEDVVPRETFYAYLKALVEAGLGKRLMFGSDGWLEESIEAINSAPFLSDEQKRDIFYNNAARFLRLSEEQMAEHHENRVTSKE